MRAAASPRRRVSPPPRLTAAASLRRHVSLPPRRTVRTSGDNVWGAPMPNQTIIVFNALWLERSVTDYLYEPYFGFADQEIAAAREQGVN
jgi:hypothetical protein